MASKEINDLLSGPLVTWLISCLEDPGSLTNYEDLVDGVLLHNIFLQIDPDPTYDGITPSEGNPIIRAKNLELLVRNIKRFYTDELGYLVLRLPDSIHLGKEPESHVAEMQLLLLLILGCAVQCPNKEKFITKIKTLDVDTQHNIMECIKQITDHPDIVITRDLMESVNMSGVFVHIEKLICEHDSYREKLRNTLFNEIFEDNDSSLNIDPEETNSIQKSNSTTKSKREDNHHYAVELADWKSKVRKQRQELEEKTEALLESKEELEHNKTLLSKLKQENQELMHEARTAKSYRDELDAVIEKADRADRLEMEVARYREKLTDIEFYKTRIEELREDNRVLMETREMLEEQLSVSRRRADKVLELESEIIKYKQLLNDVALERAADTEKYQELVEENNQLQKLSKAVTNESVLCGSNSDAEESGQTDNRLSDQLTSNAHTRALKLELENQRLMTLIDSLKENSFHENSSRVLELEKEKKKVSLKAESLSVNVERLTQQNFDLELVCKQALEENKKLQMTMKNQRASWEKQQQEHQSQHSKLIEMEQNYEISLKEKQCVQSLLESVKKRADDLERSLELSNQKIDDLKLLERKISDLNTKCVDLESKLVTLEREKETAQRDIHRYKETIEEKDVALDKATNTIEVLERKSAQLEQEVHNCVSQISRLQEIERSSKELDSRAAIDRETLETLQSNLVAEKLDKQQLYTVLEKLGLSENILLSLPPDDLFDRIARMPDIINHVKKSLTIEHICSPEKIFNEAKDDVKVNTNIDELMEPLKKEIEQLQQKLNTSQTSLENLLSENAKLQVFVTTLQSQSTSLAAQNTALQLANSQLVAEKEELLKERSTQQRTHSKLLRDQDTLQSLHEQLNIEYEHLRGERESLKSNLRDAKNELRTLRESYEKLETEYKSLKTESETLMNDVKNSSNLRTEHSKLEDDFRNLFVISEKVKIEYRNLREDHQKNRIELNKSNLKLTEMQGLLSLKDEKCSNLELQLNKLNQRCEMLLQMNSGLDNDRKSLMDHISQLFSQYHELLTHSLEDKEHYHMEEKLYTDKVNHLYRQKEKLEEKIMEHYKKLENCTTKKKSFGASIVSRVKKAGSDFLNKNRRSWAEDSKQSEFGENYSDGSVDEHKLQESADPTSLENDSLSLGNPGTRRTVYYTDDSSTQNTLLEQEDNGHSSPNHSTKVETLLEPRPFVFFNKVSAVINESRNITHSSTKDGEKNESPVETHTNKDRKESGSVWYEYGCV